MAVKFYNIQNLKKFIVPRFPHRIRTHNALWYRPLVLEVTAVPTVPQPLPNVCPLQKLFIFYFSASAAILNEPFFKVFSVEDR